MPYYCGACPARLLILAVAAILLAAAPGRLLVLASTHLGGGPPWYLCGNSGNFRDNSTYQANIKLLSTTLANNASSNLFANGSVGTGTDIVYALTLCRGDANASTCGHCVATAFQGAQRRCPFNKDAAVYYENCYLRFSDTNFFASTSNGSPVYLVSPQKVSWPVLQAFDSAVIALLNATANYAAWNSTRRYATGEMMGFDTSFPVIYGLTQCTPDLSPADCRSCLQDIFELIVRFLGGRAGARLIGVRCNFRYEVNTFFSGSPSLRLPAPEPAPLDAPPTPMATAQGRKSRRTKITAFIACSVFLILIILASALICLKRKTAKNKKALKKIERGQHVVFDLPTLQEATDNFHEKNKLGEGGFGTVYRGLLPDGQDIAVKKLSQSTRQGLNQLHNEVQVLAELQHMNLVRLLGFCLHHNEMMLVYEHVKNGSLDKVLFDPSRRDILNWEKKYDIIIGIAKGILYFHEDSSIRIVHRDLKANNILLDENMNPKIADFGLARLLGLDHTRSKTACVAGTYGYMAPEYAFSGNVSPKIDVFSYGILVLEIITGRRNGSSDESNETLHLLTEVWNSWANGEALQLIDQSSLHGHSQREVLRCIHIGLLCVQEHPDDRPNISSVVLMLTKSRVKLQQPRRPAFFFGRDSSSVHGHMHKICIYEGSDVIVEDNLSVNDITTSELYPR